MHDFSRRYCSILFLVLIAAARLSAQTPAPALKGQITDPSSAAIPNVTITATAADGTVKAAVTDSTGNFSMALPPGVYTVRGMVKGFAPFEKPGIKIESGTPVTLNAKLIIQTESQTVTVSDQIQVSTDPSSNVGQLVLNGADLEALPDDPDDLAADLQALAGPSVGPNGGQIFIDGFSGGKLPPKSSIREIRINSNPFAAEYDKLGFGRIEILTKPGTDKLHGQAFFNFGDRALNTRNPFLTASDPPPYQSKLFGGYVSGAPNKKTSFFLDIERRNIDENALIVANVLDSNYNYSDRSSGNQSVGQFNLESRAVPPRQPGASAPSPAEQPATARLKSRPAFSFS